MDPSPATGPSTTPTFTDPASILRRPRLTGLATGPDGRVLAVVAEADEHDARMVSALWELDPEGERPARRLTRSEQGESAPHLLADSSVLFTSTRPDPSGGEPSDRSALWHLPAAGDAERIATAPGGLTLLAVAEDGSALAATSVLPGGTLADDAERRTARKDARRSTIWHTGMPIRRWDHEIGDTSPRLVHVAPDGTLSDLAPDADTLALIAAAGDLSRDGRTVFAPWTERTRGGGTRSGIVRIDVATRRRETLLPGGEDGDLSAPRLSPDGRHLAVVRSTVSTPADPSYPRLEIHPLDGGEPVRPDLGDLTVTEAVWAEDGALLVAGDLHSAGTVRRVDPATGAVRALADGAVFSALAPAPDGALLALRSDVGRPAHPVRIAADGGVRELPAPGALPDLPGHLDRVSAVVDGTEVGAWLCVPHGASQAAPAPVMLWIHGGPHGSYNAWSWRWCPWFAVAQGWAVLMPDPAMSTGYGEAGLRRGWPRRPEVVWAECEGVLDHVLAREDLDAGRLALLGASFGGFLTNWIAGRSDRFGAIVTHAGLWALDQQHRTTDAAASKMRVHRHEDEEPQWYRDASPHHRAAAIRTPMLVTHGNRDHRVPVSEALRLWWDLVSAWDGEPDTMPHRFLQLTSENHWVLTPANAITWNRTVLAFCDQHVRDGEPVPDVLPW